MTQVLHPGPAHVPAGSTADRVRWVPWTLAGAGVLSQVAFPLTGGGDGAGTFALTVAAVVLLAGASLAHALLSRGAGAALALVVVAGGGAFAAEVAGVAHDVPFGGYEYTGSLGVELGGVPLLVPLAWIMMLWPALLVARRLVGARDGRPRRVAVAVVAAWALTAWDVFLDPQMVAAGHWVWDHPDPGLPGVPGIPLTNFAGWLLVSGVLVAVVDRCVGPGDDAVPVTVYLWTYCSSVMANAVFFGRPSVSLVGAVLMGVVAVPLVVGLVRGRGR